jgi:SAM-dependent methyltransferase
MDSIYTTGEYLHATETWHSEDSPWKARQIRKIFQRNHLVPGTIAELGCGAGVILSELSQLDEFQDAALSGYDISPQAIEMAKSLESERLRFFEEDILAFDNHSHFDALLVIDVFEHVPDYLGFLQKCRTKATHKVYHIPLGLHVSSVLRNILTRERYSIGHIHHFMADTALCALRDTGHEIVDYFYTNGAFGLFRQHPTLSKAIANVPRWVCSRFSPALSARVFGGYSLLVLAR